MRKTLRRAHLNFVGLREELGAPLKTDTLPLPGRPGQTDMVGIPIMFLYYNKVELQNLESLTRFLSHHLLLNKIKADYFKFPTLLSFPRLENQSPLPRFFSKFLVTCAFPPTWTGGAVPGHKALKAHLFCCPTCVGKGSFVHPTKGFSSPSAYLPRRLANSATLSFSSTSSGSRTSKQ